MPRSIMHRLKGDTAWTRATGTPPFSVSGYSAGNVIEIDDGNGVISEVTAGVAAAPAYVTGIDHVQIPEITTTTVDLTPMDATEPRQEGDLAFMIYAGASNTRRVLEVGDTAPYPDYDPRSQGWERVSGLDNLLANQTYDTIVEVWAKYMGATPDPSITVRTQGSSGQDFGLQFRVVRGAGGAITDFVSVRNVFEPGDIDPGSLSGIPANSRLMVVGANAHDGTAAANLAAPYLDNFMGLARTGGSHALSLFAGDIVEDGTGTMDLPAWTGTITHVGSSAASWVVAIPPA